MRNNRRINSDDYADKIVSEVNEIESNVENAEDLIAEVEAILHTAELTQLCEFGRF